MSEENSIASATQKTKKARARRNYQKELADLQSRVDVALRILSKVLTPDPLITVAMETLEGEK